MLSIKGSSCYISSNVLILCMSLTLHRAFAIRLEKQFFQSVGACNVTFICLNGNLLQRSIQIDQNNCLLVKYFKFYRKPPPFPEPVMEFAHFPCNFEGLMGCAQNHLL